MPVQPTQPLPNGAKIVASETVPVISAALTITALQDINNLLTDHLNWWWDLSKYSGLFTLLGFALFGFFRYLNGRLVTSGMYRDELRSATVAKAWAGVPFPLELLVEWAEARSKQLPPAQPSAPPTPQAPSEPPAPERSTSPQARAPSGEPTKVPVTVPVVAPATAPAHEAPAAKGTSPSSKPSP
jgi:hypothetical protein